MLFATLYPMITSISQAPCRLFHTLSQGCHTVLKMMIEVIRFPTRYFGAKIRSAYPTKELTNSETLLFLKHVSVARAVRSGDERWISPLGFAMTGYNFIDIHTGLQVAVTESKDEVIVGFGARGWDGGSLTEEKDMSTYKNTQLGVLAGNPLGFTPRCYEQASELFQDIQKQYSHKKISISGICYGGAIASYVALQNRVSAFCFNSYTLGAGLQQAIGEEKLKMADHLITHLSTKDDLVSDNKFLQLFDRALSFLGIKTPGRFGRRFTIPRHYSGVWENHIHVYATMMHHMGYPTSTKTSDIPKQELESINQMKPVA